MKHRRTIGLMFLMSVFFTTAAIAQGFGSFDVTGAMFKANIKNNVKGTSTIEVIVGEDVDLTNVKFKYRLISGCRMEDKISNDFTEPQKVEVSRGAESKEWIIEVKKLQPAQLPLEISFSKDDLFHYDSSVVGWVGVGVDVTKPTVIRFGNHSVSFIVAFKDEAKDVSYSLNVVGAKGSEFDGKFEVTASADGKDWKAVTTYDSKNPFTTDSDFTDKLDSDARFVKWTYVSRNKQNVNLNNIIVSPK